MPRSISITKNIKNQAHEDFKRFGSLRKHSNPMASLKPTRKLKPRNKKQEINNEAALILNNLILDLNTRYPYKSSPKKSSLSKYGFINSLSTGSNKDNKQIKINTDEGGKHTYATISHFKTPSGSFRKSTKRNKSSGYAKLIKRNKKSTSQKLKSLRGKHNVREIVNEINKKNQ